MKKTEGRKSHDTVSLTLHLLKHHSKIKKVLYSRVLINIEVVLKKSGILCWFQNGAIYFCSKLLEKNYDRKQFSEKNASPK
jgi:hypothetical protein